MAVSIGQSSVSESVALLRDSPPSAASTVGSAASANPLRVLALSAAAAAHLTVPSEVKASSAAGLVRPDVEVDPAWGQYADDARESYELKYGPGSANCKSNYGIQGLKNLLCRRKDDADIARAEADASELPAREKVFLLVSRILTDKTSLPGHVYRVLTLFYYYRRNEGSDSCSSCREDVRGIIKHVTAALLEARPGLASSRQMTELAASAVEELIFGELSDDCLDEILDETEDKDERLATKVEDLRQRGAAGVKGISDEVPHVSQAAVLALRNMPQAQSPSSKLIKCSEFLERVSDHYTFFLSKRKGGTVVDGDTILMMVCQHVVAADVENLHAEVAFIEEFARDMRLLSGREGYAFITLQAALHYLDSLEDLPSDLLLPLTY